MVIRYMGANACPHCESTWYVKNGTTRHGKQNYKCKCCNRQFSSFGRTLVDITRDYIHKDEAIRRLLLERISLRGICRVLSVGMHRVLNLLRKIIDGLPEDLGVVLPPLPDGYCRSFYLTVRPVECDEMWSFVRQKANRYWIWLALDRDTRQVVGFHIGPRTIESAQALWASLPAVCQLTGRFYTDELAAYRSALPPTAHIADWKKSGTNHIERFNNTLRQRCSRLVRQALSFSKKVENHIGAIRYHIWAYNKSLNIYV